MTRTKSTDRFPDEDKCSLTCLFVPLGSAGLRLLEVVLPVPLRSVRLRLQRPQRDVHGLREGHQTGENGGKVVEMSNKNDM